MKPVRVARPVPLRQAVYDTLAALAERTAEFYRREFSSS
jgi:hypothetical protein